MEKEQERAKISRDDYWILLGMLSMVTLQNQELFRSIKNTVAFLVKASGVKEREARDWTEDVIFSADLDETPTERLNILLEKLQIDVEEGTDVA